MKNFKKQIAIVSFMILISVVFESIALCQIKTIDLSGTIGSSSEFKSGWMDLTPPFNFMRNDSIKIEVGGSARVVLIRLLNVRDSPDSQTGIVGKPCKVNNGEVYLKLTRDYPAIKQISVHGGSPWGNSLVVNNGNATVQHVTLYRQ
jgi:hypothetical protein